MTLLFSVLPDVMEDRRDIEGDHQRGSQGRLIPLAEEHQSQGGSKLGHYN